MKTDTNLSEKFRRMAENVQAVVTDVENWREAFSRAVEITAARNGETIAAAGFSDEQTALLKTLCEEKGIRLYRYLAFWYLKGRLPSLRKEASQKVASLVPFPS